MKPARPFIALRPASGFTLLEMLIVIMITGILAAVVAVFMRAPIDGYFDSVRRAELTDQADVALRRITRDVRLALPNSLRVTTAGGVRYIEFIMTSAGGRYRDPTDGSTGGNFLSFTNAGSLTFDVHGPMPAITPGSDFIVVYNLGPGYAPANAYADGNTCTSCNRARIAGVSGNTITLASNPFASQSPPLPSPSGRFQIVPGNVGAVTYACPSGASGNLQRYAGYGFSSTQATPPVATAALVATNASCTVNYTPSLGGRNGLLEIALTLANVNNTESVTLVQQIRVDNSP